MLSGIFLSVGIYHVCNNLKYRNIALTTTFLLIVGSGYYLSSVKNYRGDYDFTLKYATSVLESLEKNSILMVGGDVETSVLSYARYVLMQRPDIDIIHQNGRLLNTRIYDSRYLSYGEKKSKFLSFIKKSERPVYLTSFISSVGLEDHWLYYKVNTNLPDNALVISELSPHQDFLTSVFVENENITDDWTIDFSERLKTKAIPGLFQRILKSKDKNSKLEHIKRVQSLFYNITNFINANYYIKTFSLYEEFGGMIELNNIGDNLFSVELDGEKRASYLNFKAQFLLGNRDYINAMSLYFLSREEWSSPRNVAHRQISLLCKKQELSQNTLYCNHIK